MLVALALLLLVSAQGAPPVASADDLAVVRQHYAAAAYEEALGHVGTLDPERVTPELEQYRALCLMALGRSEDGQQAFERLVRRAPLYMIPDAEISPRMMTVFRDVRRRVLPLVLRDLYTNGKASFDAKRYEAAVTELGQLMRLLNDPDAAADAATFADLRQLTDGFLRLSEAELALARAASAPAATPPVRVAETAAASDGLTVTKIVVYSREDRDVTPPVELQRFMPPWNPPSVIARRLEYRGELEVIVDENGRVQQAGMLRPSIPSYDVSLIAATDSWRFGPARRNGAPVKYRLVFEVVLAPPQ